MKNGPHLSAAARSYATAHAAQYGAKDLRQAFALYQNILASHPDTEEAGYSRSQIENLAKAVVPEPELFAAEVALTRSHLETADSAKVPADPIAAGSSG